MPRFVEGKRIRDAESLETLQPGNYEVRYADDGRIECVWFAIPGFRGYEDAPILNRINGPAATAETKWEITEDDEGKITVSPSILTWWPETTAEGKVERRFHAYLRGGTWEVLDDTAGATWDDADAP